MSNKKAELSKHLHFFFSDRKSKYFLCPDAETRRLVEIKIEDDKTTLSFISPNQTDQAMEYCWPNPDVETHFKQFRRVSQQQAQGKTQLPAVTADDALTPSVRVLSPAEQAVRLLDPTGALDQVTDGLMAAFDKLQSTPGYIDQARAMNEVGKTVIDVFKTRVMAVKILTDSTKK